MRQSGLQEEKQEPIFVILFCRMKRHGQPSLATSPFVGQALQARSTVRAARAACHPGAVHLKRTTKTPYTCPSTDPLRTKERVRREVTGKRIIKSDGNRPLGDVTHERGSRAPKLASDTRKQHQKKVQFAVDGRRPYVSRVGSRVCVWGERPLCQQPVSAVRRQKSCAHAVMQMRNDQLLYSPSAAYRTTRNRAPCASRIRLASRS